MKKLLRPWIVFLCASLLQACSGGEPVTPERYTLSDQFVASIKKNVSAAPGLQLVTDIDHSRLGHEAGSPMPPSRVVIFSDPQLETALILANPLAALDLPLRVLAYEAIDEGATKVIYNAFDYLVSRYSLDGEQLPTLRAQDDEALKGALAGLPTDVLAAFEKNVMQPDGIVTIDSPYDFAETVKRVNAAIDSQDDTMHFGVVDFQQNAQRLGVEIHPSHLILFGGPGPGGKAMAGSPTLGLDGFCQKFLIWQDDNGAVHLSFNDLLALAKRPQVPIAPALRVIDFRLGKVFGDALADQ